MLWRCEDEALMCGLHPDSPTLSEEVLTTGQGLRTGRCSSESQRPRPGQVVSAESLNGVCERRARPSVSLSYSDHSRTC